MPGLSPRVSVVLPFFNAVDTLHGAVASVRAQTFAAWELALVDDGSTDGGGDLAAKLAREDGRLRLVQQANAGVAAAMNTGVAGARGEYVARIDADDVMLPDRLARQVARLDRDPETGVLGCRVRFGGDVARAEGYARYVAWTNTLLDDASIRRNRFIEQPIVNPSVMFRRSLWELHGGCREGDFPEDYELWLRWLDAGVRFAKAPEELLIWNDPPQRLTRNHPRYSIDAFYRIKAAYLARELQRQDTENGHRTTYLWGAGKTTRQRAAFLEAEGIAFAGYIDIDPRKIGQRIAGKPVLAPEGLPGPDKGVVIAMVGSRGAREKIRDWLQRAGYHETQDFWMAS
ncbi:MAG: glycosyltransferase [Opitutales bacterium]